MRLGKEQSAGYVEDTEVDSIAVDEVKAEITNRLDRTDPADSNSPTLHPRRLTHDPGGPVFVVVRVSAR